MIGFQLLTDEPPNLALIPHTQYLSVREPCKHRSSNTVIEARCVPILPPRNIAAKIYHLYSLVEVLW